MVVVGRQPDDGCIDGVMAGGVREQHAGTAPECIVQAGNVDAGERTSKQHLPTEPISPDLGDDAAVRQGRCAAQLRRLQPAPHRAVVAL